MNFEQFQDYCMNELNLTLSASQMGAFTSYLALLKEWNVMFNLTAITDEAQFRARQKSFDRTLWTLEAAVEQAQEEAGL